MKTINKTLYTFLLVVLCLGPFLKARAQTSTYNYVRTRVPRTAIKTISALDALSSNKDSVNITITYIDGLGRPIQPCKSTAITPAVKI